LATLPAMGETSREQLISARKSWLKKIFGIFLPSPLQFIFARIIFARVADESL
jgi:hypothetical protein